MYYTAISKVVINYSSNLILIRYNLLPPPPHHHSHQVPYYYYLQAKKVDGKIIKTQYYRIIYLVYRKNVA